MKFICIREVKIEGDYYKNNKDLPTNIGNNQVFLIPGEYKVSYNKTSNVVLHNVSLRVGEMSCPLYCSVKNIEIHKNELLNDGYFEANLIDKLVFKNNIDRLNKKDDNFVTKKEKAETIKEAKQILRNISIDILKKMPVSMKSAVILSDLNKNKCQKLDEKQLKEINEILKYPCEGDVYDFNIFDEIHNIKDLEELFEQSNYADMGIYPKYKQTCKKCGHTFYLNNTEIKWYLIKNLNIPKKCEFCRKGLKRPEKVKAKSKISNESLEEETVKTEMQIALEKAGITGSEQK